MPKNVKPQPGLVRKQILFPADWIERIDKARGDEPLSDFVRRAVLKQIDSGSLSEMPQWGQGRPRSNSD